MARDVRFGLWYHMRNPEPWKVPNEQLYRDTIDQIEWAEGLGYGSVWFTEHFFCDDGYTPSALILAGAVGQRTKQMRIGTNLMLLPLHDPLRLAGDVATMSILTGGRFDLGVGLGYRAEEFAAFGRKLSHRPSLMEEAVAILRQAWSGEPIEFEGKRFSVPAGLRVTPVPATPPRILMGGMSEPAIKRAARLGDGFLATGGIGSDIYLQACAEAGTTPSIYAGHWGIVDEDPERVAAEVGPHALYEVNEYIKWGAFGPPDQVPPFPDAAAALEHGLYQVMDPATAVTELTSMLQACPEIVDVHFWARFPGEPVAAGARRIELLAKDVLPKVRANLA